MIGISKAEKLRQLELSGESIPPCICHGEPMTWNKCNKKVQGGSWTCIVKARERDKKWKKDKYQNSIEYKETVLNYKKDYYSENSNKIKKRQQDKYHSDPSIRERITKYNKERYQNDPEVRRKAKEYSYKRRARLSCVKRIPYTKIEVWQKCSGICYICNKPVDPNLKYPDPSSGVMHHIHPIKKRGIDALKNMMLAHNFCNGSIHDKYESVFENWNVKPIDAKLAQNLFIKNHYLHRRSNISFSYGLFDYENNLLGAVAFGATTSWRVNKSICPDDPHKVLELNRLWVDDNAPFGAASWFVSRALKELPPRIIVSYADLGVNHIGTVYKALSFNYAGQSKPRKEWRFPGKSRNVGKVPGAILYEVTPKNRFWTVTGTKRDKKQLRALIKWPALLRK